MRRHDLDEVEPAAVLSPEALLAAIPGHFDAATPLVEWARELGGLHAARISEQADPVDFDAAAEIARIVAAIDSWAALHVHRNLDARKESHSLGEVLSRVVGTYVQARWTVLHPVNEQVQRAAWRHLGEAQEGYGRLVADIEMRYSAGVQQNPRPDSRPE
ncbi:hypothetical protein ACFWF7_39095 [Nocardia sp. NPDC060256]|uniref:hypothetical protein n=1 Tax=unclassified Nocardia TaxID=2637762 RepID=UPI00364E7B0C